MTRMTRATFGISSLLPLFLFGISVVAKAPDVELDYVILKGKANAGDHSWEYLGQYAQSNHISCISGLS